MFIDSLLKIGKFAQFPKIVSKTFVKGEFLKFYLTENFSPYGINIIVIHMHCGV